jgi:hypothetical protein
MDGRFKIVKYYVRISLLNFINYSVDIISIIINYKAVKRYAKNIDRDKTIGLISDKFMSRIDKIAHGLAGNGYHIVLICKNPEHFDKTFSTIFTYRSNFKALWLAKQFNVSVYHTFSNWNYGVSYYVIKHRSQLQSSIVFDDYDVMAGMVYEAYANTRYPGHLKKEKYCLEHADGLCCRSLETQYAKRALHYRYKGKRIFFPEYPWKSQPVDGRNAQKKEKTIIYVGGYNSMVRSIAVELQKIGWSLDIYPAHLIKKNKYDFPDNVHVFKSVNPRELAQALQPYEIAIQFPGTIISENMPRYTPHKFYYSAAGKIFDYLEAGTKVLISDSIHQKWILKRYGAAIDIDENDAIGDIIKKLSAYHENATGASPQLNIDHLTIIKQTKRLIKFYKTLARS